MTVLHMDTLAFAGWEMNATIGVTGGTGSVGAPSQQVAMSIVVDNVSGPITVVNVPSGIVNINANYNLQLGPGFHTGYVQWMQPTGFRLNVLNTGQLAAVGYEGVVGATGPAGVVGALPFVNAVFTGFVQPTGTIATAIPSSMIVLNMDILAFSDWNFEGQIGVTGGTGSVGIPNQQVEVSVVVDGTVGPPSVISVGSGIFNVTAKYSPQLAPGSHTGYVQWRVPTGFRLNKLITGQLAAVGYEGVVGATGPAGGPIGPTGSVGQNAFSVTPTFTQPPIGGTVVISIPTGIGWVQNNQNVYIAGAGTLQVVSAAGSTLTLLNPGYVNDVSPGTVINPSNMGPDGQAGVTGATGPLGPQGVTGPTGPIGPQGIQGPTGPNGGAQGPPGLYTGTITVPTTLWQPTGFSGANLTSWLSTISTPSGSNTGVPQIYQLLTNSICDVNTTVLGINGQNGYSGSPSGVFKMDLNGTFIRGASAVGILGFVAATAQRYSLQASGWSANIIATGTNFAVIVSNHTNVPSGVTGTTNWSILSQLNQRQF